MSKKNVPRETDATPGSEPIFIVGIGASAGGVEALTQFFEQVPADSGLAYVVILHLSPGYDSQLAQILQGVAAIPVAQQVASRPYPVPESITPLPQFQKQLPQPAPEQESRPTPRPGFGDLPHQLLEQYAPPSIIVNGGYDILHVTPPAGRYLHVAGASCPKIC